MADSENAPLSEKDLKNIFNEAILAYQKRDYFQARELLEIIVAQDPLYTSNERRASDLLADVEFHLAEKSSAIRKSRIFGGLTIFLAATTLIAGALFIFSSLKTSQLQKTGASINATLASQTGLLQSAYTTVTAASLKADSAQATMTTMRQSPGSAQATIQSYESQTANGSLSNQPIFGPVSGKLLHDDSGFVISEDAMVNQKNLILQARFLNPYGSEEGGFDYGFFFRDTGGDHQYRLVVNSDSEWIFDFVNDPDWTEVDSGKLSNMVVSVGGSNLIRVVVLDDNALFYFNNIYVSTLSTQAKLEAGDVYIVTASYEDHEIIGRSTGYEDFTIWPLP